MAQDSINQDQIFLAIFRDLIEEAITSAEKSLENIVKVSSRFVSEGVHSDLMEFYKLYFQSTDEMDQKTEDINRGVDDIIEQARKMSSDELADENVVGKISESSKAEEARISLSYLQKKFESLIALEEGIRAQLSPVLASMKCEDMTRRRLNTVMLGVTGIVESLGPDFSESRKSISEEIRTQISSQEERTMYNENFPDEESSGDNDDFEDIDEFWESF